MYVPYSDLITVIHLHTESDWITKLVQSVFPAKH